MILAGCVAMRWLVPLGCRSAAPAPLVRLSRAPPPSAPPPLRRCPPTTHRPRHIHHQPPSITPQGHCPLASPPLPSPSARTAPPRPSPSHRAPRPRPARMRLAGRLSLFVRAPMRSPRRRHATGSAPVARSRAPTAIAPMPPCQEPQGIIIRVVPGRRAGPRPCERDRRRRTRGGAVSPARARARAQANPSSGTRRGRRPTSSEEWGGACWASHRCSFQSGGQKGVPE